MRISDWSSDVCSSDLIALGVEPDGRARPDPDGRQRLLAPAPRASGDDRGLCAWRGGATARDRPSQLLRDRRRRLRHLRHRPYRLFRGCRGMTDAYKIIDHTYDTVVVGAGGSGLRATMGSEIGRAPV